MSLHTARFLDGNGYKKHIRYSRRIWSESITHNRERQNRRKCRSDATTSQAASSRHLQLDVLACSTRCLSKYHHQAPIPRTSWTRSSHTLF